MAFCPINRQMGRSSGPGADKLPANRADLPAARRGMANLLGSSSASIRGELESLARKLNITI